jgi:glucuronoarabinoxylan endo-1,4-beta-xylanase
MNSIADSSRRTLLAGLVLAAGGCWETGGRPDPEPVGPTTVMIDTAQRRQIIDGFGASSAWTANNVSDVLADQLFSVETGVGLSLLRVQIKPTGVTNEMRTAEKAVARGAKVWAAPWSPPAEWKTNGSTINGGSLLPEHRADWANRLAALARTMADGGVPLLAISAQNEPNYADDWDTCIYTPAELVTFVRDFLGPALRAQGLDTPVMAPESANWTSFAQFAEPFAADPAAMAFVGPFATHAYGGGGPHVVAAVENSGKHVWQTEVSDPNESPDPGIGSGLAVAKMLHDNLVGGNVSAWHYWWINPNGQNARDNSALTSGGQAPQLARRAWVMGNWSRFVRPGFVRVAATPLPQPLVYVTAFQDPATGKLVIVAINQNDAPRDDDPPTVQTFSIAGTSVAELTPWVTSADLMLGQGTPVAVTADGTFTATLAARSVTTFVSP